MVAGRVRRDLSVWEWVAAAVVAVMAVYFLVANVVHLPVDFAHIWQGEKQFADGSSPYVRHPTFNDFVFAPSAAIALWPEAVSQHLSSRLAGLANLVLIAWLALGTWWASAGEDRRSSRLWALAMLAVAYFLCARMGRGNVDILTESLVLVSLVVLSKRVRGRLGRPWVAGLALGLAITFKITAIPVLLLFLLVQEWVAVAVAVAVPVVLGAVAVLRVPDMRRWFTWTVPYLRNREPVARPLDVSLRAAFPHASNTLGDVLLVVGLVVVVVWLVVSGLLSSDGSRSFSVLVLVSTMFMLVVFIASPGGLTYYWVYALPALVVVGSDRLAAIVAAVALVGLAVPASVADKLGDHGLRLPDDLHSLAAFVLLFVAVVIALRARTEARHHTAAVP